MATPNLSQGTYLQISANGTTYYSVPFVENLTVPDVSAPTIETSSLSSSSATFIKGIPDYGTISGSYRYDYDTDVSPIIENNLAAYGSTTIYFKVGFPNLSTPKVFSGQGYVTSHSVSSSTNSVRQASFSIKVTGALSTATITT